MSCLFKSPYSNWQQFIKLDYIQKPAASATDGEWASKPCHLKLVWRNRDCWAWRRRIPGKVAFVIAHHSLPAPGLEGSEVPPTSRRCGCSSDRFPLLPGRKARLRVPDSLVARRRLVSEFQPRHDARNVCHFSGQAFKKWVGLYLSLYLFNSLPLCQWMQTMTKC